MAKANLGACLSGGWNLFKQNALTHVVAFALVSLVTSISMGLLAGPMLVGYLRMIAREDNGEKAQIGDVFRGFDNVVPALVAGLISFLVLSLGFALCFIPGLLILALPTVALYLVAQGESDGVAAFNRAWSVVTKNLGSAFWCALVLGIASSLGMLLCWVGILVTAPISMIGSFYMARQLLGEEAPRLEQA